MVKLLIKYSATIKKRIEDVQREIEEIEENTKALDSLF